MELSVGCIWIHSHARLFKLSISNSRSNLSMAGYYRTFDCFDFRNVSGNCGIFTENKKIYIDSQLPFPEPRILVRRCRGLLPVEVPRRHARRHERPVVFPGQGLSDRETVRRPG